MPYKNMFAVKILKTNITNTPQLSTYIINSYTNTPTHPLCNVVLNISIPSLRTKWAPQVALHHFSGPCKQTTTSVFN